MAGHKLVYANRSYCSLGFNIVVFQHNESALIAV
jgi:hypothetical protein